MNIIFNTLNTLLEQVFHLTGDWGITIILLTLLVRILLLPISLKQRRSMETQQNLAKKMEEIKQQYKDDKEKMEAELSKYSLQSAKSMLGCLVTLLQMPVMFTLYNIFLHMPVQVGSIIIPWVSSLKLPDSYYIIPVVSVLVQMAPNLLASAGALNCTYVPKATKFQLITAAALNLLFLAKAPVTIGIYWVTSTAFSALEQIGYSLYMRNSRLRQSNA